MKIIPEHLDLFAKAIRYYEWQGYQNIEVPWFISREASRSVMPKERNPFEVLKWPPTSIKAIDLPGSAEQSFVQLMIENKLNPGKYQSLTPCFRDEPVVDDLHQTTFMKLELIDFNLNASLLSVVTDAHRFFEKHITCDVVPTGDGYDILSKDDIELGSYGKRSFAGFSWIYGTGLAQPRFSLAWYAATLF